MFKTKEATNIVSMVEITFEQFKITKEWSLGLKTWKNQAKINLKY